MSLIQRSMIGRALLTEPMFVLLSCTPGSALACYASHKIALHEANVIAEAGKVDLHHADALVVVTDHQLLRIRCY
jgi:hypothetical protein